MNRTVPRQESWREDYETGEAAVKKMLAVSLFKNAAQQKKAEERNRIEIYQHLRAGATSGMGFQQQVVYRPERHHHHPDHQHDRG